MVNYKRVVCEVALLAALVVIAAAAPADCDRHYDQRQNGSENYRLNIDGVVIAVAPADSLLAAASDIDISDLLDLDDFNEVKPKPPSTTSPPKPHIEPKPEDAKPEAPAKPDAPAEAPLSDVSLTPNLKSQKKDATTRKQEKAQRLKNKIAHLLLPLLRRNRHH
ncbi:nucleolar and coiled-body phosphoprotein 1 [Ostrinia furnacalis]|uniref:nucleolar and coiled-body phosphoprotein 1 n=1 Tax=Ostrinia furnacalis TaxID=93504 RepID=UPI001039E46D|nr:nucleolar and coiled-body phosphoprotein 1 [Ostrinia furnacalis]